VGARAWGRGVHADGGLQRQGFEQGVHACGFGVVDFPGQEREAQLGHASGGVALGLPGDERGGHAIEGHAAIGRDGDEPLECATAHGLDEAQGLWSRRRTRVDVFAAHHPGGERGGRVRGEAIQVEPAGTPRCGGRGVDGDDFQKGVGAQAHEQVMGAHAGVLASGLGGHPEHALHPGSAFGEGWGGDGDVVEMAGGHFLAPRMSAS